MLVATLTSAGKRVMEKLEDSEVLKDKDAEDPKKEKDSSKDE